MSDSALIYKRICPKPAGPVLVSVPHAGLVVPEERKDLMLLPKEVFMRDVDYEVHRFWEQSCAELGVSFVKAEVHRYAIDLNRKATQIDASVVEGHERPAGSETRGLIWTRTTLEEPLGPGGKPFKPLPAESVNKLIEHVWKPYYDCLETELKKLKEKFGYAILIDGHSMPSKGTSFHADPSAVRPDIVPGDFHGKACHPAITQCSQLTGEKHGFSMSVNKPYAGGGITQHFGRPQEAIHALQIEVNRRIYMNESSKELFDDGLKKLSAFTRDFIQSLLQLKL